MKTFTITIFLLLLFGCKKDSLQKKIEGKWELRETYVGSSSNTYHQFLPGNGNTFEFTSSNYRADTSNQLFRTGNFSIVKDTMYSQMVSDRLILDNYLFYPFIRVDRDEMALIQEGRKNARGCPRTI